MTVYKRRRGFTLVELIVVITILAVLSTIGFVSFSGYLAGTRDTNRISQLKSMSDALELYKTKKDLPLPDDKIDIRIGSGSLEEVIAYQGFIGKNVLETIEYTESGLDPKDKQYFTYILTKNKKHFQLMAFLEEENEDVVAISKSLNNIQAIDYSERKFLVKGKKIGVLLDTFNTPVQEIDLGVGSGYLNIENTEIEYKAVVENGYELVGTGSELKMLKGTILTGGVSNSCKIILKKNSKLKGKDGYYLINQEEPKKVYCDMTSNGGGWTRYISITGDYTFNDAKKCWLAKSSWKNTGNTIDCFNPNRLNFTVNKFMLKQDFNNDGNWKIWTRNFKKDYPSQIENIEASSRKCKGGPEYMTIMKNNSSYPKTDTSDTSYVWLGLSFCNDSVNTREVGGRAGGNNFMNYSANNFGIAAGKKRETTVRPVEMFIK